MRCAWLPLLALGCGSTAVDDEDCARFVDQAPQREFQVRFTNARTEVVFVGEEAGCGSLEPISLKNDKGQLELLSLGDCGNGCERLQRGALGCAAICRIPEIVQIAPGGHHDFAWNGSVYVQAAMPSGCYRESQQAPASCAKSVVAPPGPYQVSGSVWPVADCSSAGHPCATCTPDASGSCTISGGHVSGQVVTKNVTLEVPTSTSVELVFD
jgi:hypothetical protein